MSTDVKTEEKETVKNAPFVNVNVMPNLRSGSPLVNAPSPAAIVEQKGSPKQSRLWKAF